MRFHVAGITDIGNHRQENQDSFVVQSASSSGDALLAVVADGVGGGKAGNVASRIAVDTLRELYLAGGCEEEGAVARAIETAHGRIMERSRADDLCRGMATTCTALVVRGEDAVIGHVGDSRAYRIRGGEIVQLTEDHTLPRRLFKEGLISEKEVELHPQSNVLTNAIGSRGKVEIELVPSQVRDRDIFVLCSDGLHKYMKAEEIGEVVCEGGAQASAERFIALAKERGGDDNITVVVIQAAGDDLRKTTEITTIYEEPAEPAKKVPLWRVLLLVAVIAAIVAIVVLRYN